MLYSLKLYEFSEANKLNLLIKLKENKIISASIYFCFSYFYSEIKSNNVQYTISFSLEQLRNYNFFSLYIVN